jgi:hypothetical protein
MYYTFTEYNTFQLCARHSKYVRKEPHSEKNSEEFHVLKREYKHTKSLQFATISWLKLSVIRTILSQPFFAFLPQQSKDRGVSHASVKRNGYD